MTRMFITGCCKEEFKPLILIDVIFCEVFLILPEEHGIFKFKKKILKFFKFNA